MTLTEIAQRAMLDRGFLSDFSPEVMQEVAALQAPAAPPSPPSLRDRRDTLWISIDNDDSLDLDQLTYAEKRASGQEKIYVAIADVDGWVKPASAIDKHAARNTTSIYTPAINFSMLPPQLSYDLTSLIENADRTAIVVEMDIGSEGQFDLADIYPALVRNQAKLAYNGVAAWMDHRGQLPPLQGLPEQLKLQDRLAQRIKEYRYRQGALSFGTVEVQPTVVDGVCVELQETVHTRANALIENFMIAANVGITLYLEARKVPLLKRVVRDPERWDRIVSLAQEHGETLPAYPDVKALRDFLLKQRRADREHFPDLSLAIIKLIGRGEYVVAFPDKPSPGHFDLALHDYAHTTAPNRRFPDLIMQRLLKSLFLGATSPYGSDDLLFLAQHCTEREDAATKVERRVKKSAAAMVLEPQIGHSFSALVTGSNEKGTWVRLLAPPVEGKLVKGFKGVDVGDRITVQLIHVDIPQGYIDFAHA